MTEKTWRDFPELQRESLKKMILEDGMSNNEIAKRVGCGRASVMAAVKAQKLCSEQIRMLRSVARAKRFERVKSAKAGWNAAK
ncbi:MAG TPA: hypothetical protein O0X39_07645 [Methanocorpusculum sp.]|nr:hypothetical protein [Methanocorpusculum sp.]